MPPLLLHVVLYYNVILSIHIICTIHVYVCAWMCVRMCVRSIFFCYCCSILLPVTGNSSAATSHSHSKEIFPCLASLLSKKKKSFFDAQPHCFLRRVVVCMWWLHTYSQCLCKRKLGNNTQKNRQRERGGDRGNTSGAHHVTSFACRLEVL